MFDPATDDPENRRTHMGKVKEYAQDWLERGGFELGYDIGNLPALGDFNGILLNDMPAEEYFDKPTKTEQKGINNNDNSSTRHREPSSSK